MKSLRKRALGILLVFTLVASLLPATARAVSAPDNSSEQYAYASGILSALNNGLAPADQYTLRGPAKLGASHLYTYTIARTVYDEETGKYTVDTVYVIVPGINADPDNSKIPDYASAKSDQPWAEGALSTVYIGDGVTGIGNHAFDNVTTLTKMVIEDPSDLTRVGEYAFNGCDQLAYPTDAPLNLSSVTELGQYAFNGCNRLGSVTLGEGLTNIPQNTFNSCGLTSIQIPSTVTVIGNSAFSNNSFRNQPDGTLSLPDGLKTIGDNAFFLSPNDTESASGFQTLVIPSTVESIGSGAFSGHRRLSSITVLDESNGGSGKSQLNYLGNAAFGKDTYTAYSENRTITDDVNPDITYTGLGGADFYLPNDENVQELFVNGKTCYTGNISPLTYLETVNPTCEDDGYHVYNQTVPNTSVAGETVTMVLHVPIEALGHDWAFSKSYIASCEEDSYDLYVCQNDPDHTERRNIVENSKTGHNYTLTGITGYQLGNGDVTLTYTCQHDNHDNDRDSCNKIVTIPLNVSALSGTTAQTVGDLTLPTLSAGTLSWADDVDTDMELTGNTMDLHVKFTPSTVIYANYTGITSTAVDGYHSTDLTIRVNISKAKLDFSQVMFNYARNFIVPGSTGTRPIEVVKTGLPDDVTYSSPVYSNATGYSETTPPALGSQWNGLVTVTFHYDVKKYEIDTSKAPAPQYTFDTTTDGKVVISHSYDIIQSSMDELKASAISGLYYTGSEQNTIHLSGVPYESTISWTWKDSENNTGSGSTTSPNNSNSPDVAPFTEAGTYTVTVTVSKAGYETKVLSPVTVTIQKATVETPVAAQNVIYNGQEQTGLTTPGADAHYSYTSASELTGINAGHYAATAQLVDKNNYKWSTTNQSEDIVINWSIAKVKIVETEISSTYRSVPYTGGPYTAVGQPASPTGLFTISYNDSGTLIGRYDKDGDGTADTEAFTITNAKQTNAATYTAIASVTDFTNFCWADHQDQQQYALGSWTISRMQVNAPALSAPSTTYDGFAYHEPVELTHSAASGSNVSSNSIISGVGTLTYYTAATGGTALSEIPVSAGTYYVSAGWDFEDGLIPGNYQILNSSRAQFTIQKATLTIAQPSDQSEVYTSDGVIIQTPTGVSGIVSSDQGNTDLYNYTYSYQYKGPYDIDYGNTTFATAETVFHNIGSYKVTIGISSTNYQADEVSYTLTITKAEQTLTLSPDANTRIDGDGSVEDPYTVTKTLGDIAFTVKGSAALDSGRVTISYTASEEKDTEGNTEDIITVENNGEVALKAAGTATVTVNASETDNVNASHTTYKLIITKATPIINVSAYTDGKFETAYTGSAITGYQLATLTGVSNGAAPTGDLVYTFYEEEDCTTEIGTPSAVGIYYLKIGYRGDKNYHAAADQVIPVTITAEDLTVSITGYSGTYDGTKHDAAVVTKVTGSTGTIDNSDYAVFFAITSNNKQPAIDSSEWKTSLQVQDVADSSGTTQFYWYKIVAANHNPAIGGFTVTIHPKVLTVTGVSDSFQKTYDGNNKITNLDDITILTGVTNESITVDSATGTYEDKNAGKGKDMTIELALTGISDWGNYSYNDAPLAEGKLILTVEDAGEIAKKEITVIGGIRATNKVYDGENTIDLTGTPTVADGAFVNNDDVRFVESSGKTGTVADANVGTLKTVTVSAATLNSLLDGADQKNYTVSAAYTDAKASIIPRPVYLLFPGQTDQTDDWTKEVFYHPNGLTSQPSVYQVTAKNTDADSGFVGNDSLTGTDIAYTFVNSEGDPVTNPKDLGIYTVTAKLSDTVESKFSNYEIDHITGSIEIVKNNDALTVTITPKTGLTYNGLGQDPIDSITVTGGTETLTEGTGYSVLYSLTDSDTPFLSHTQLTEAVKDAKTYTIYYKVITTNYGDKTGSFTVTVDRAELTLSRTVKNTRSYNGTVDATSQVTNVNLAGQQNNETISAALDSAVYNAAAVADAEKITITYTLTAQGGASLSNYKVKIDKAAAVNATGTMAEDVAATITKASVTVIIQNQTAVYDGAKPELDQKKWNVSGTIYQLDGSHQDDLSITLHIPDHSKNVGKYDITGTAANGNYDVAFENGTFNITARPIQVTIGNGSGVYGDDHGQAVDNSTNTLLTAEATGTDRGLADGESLADLGTILLDTDAIATSSASSDSYSIYAVDQNGMKIEKPTQYGNYLVTFVDRDARFTIHKRPITITIADKSSNYGCNLEQLTYTVAYTGDSSKAAIVNSDDVVIDLHTTATNNSHVGTYEINATVTGAANYDVSKSGSWKGWEAGTYTISKANLTIGFSNTSVNVSMGGTVDNDLEFTNADSNKQLSAQPLDVEVTYESSDKSVATVDPSTGVLAILGTGDATITAKVTDGGQNYNGGNTASYVIHVAGASTGIQVQAIPNIGLTYTGTMQELLANYTVTPSNAAVTFTVEALTDGDRCEINSDGKPVAQDAGTYKVSWTAKLAGYADIKGWVNITIGKADPSTGFSQKTVQTAYAEGKTYNSTANTTLNKAKDYNGTITYLSNNTQVAKVNNNDLTNIAINATGSATISASFAETDNYKAQTVFFDLTVTNASSTIAYTAADYTVTYDGQAHGSQITVTSPSTYTIKYSNDKGLSYTLDASPVITNVDEGMLTIYYQIQAPGYTAVTGTQTVTIQPKAIDEDDVCGVATSYTYTNTQITTPTLTVTNGTTLLIKEQDYTVTYGANQEVGKSNTENLADGGGYVKVTGKGNYTGTVTKYFEITAVNASYLTATLDRYFGYYGDDRTNNATVTVTHGSHPVTSGNNDTVTITVFDSSGKDITRDVSLNGQTMTFQTAGVYKVQVEVTGSHTGNFILYYTLLPQNSSGNFNITGLSSNVVSYDGTNHAFTPVVSVNQGTFLTAGTDYTLTYSYTPFSGTAIDHETYDPANTQMIEAGLYLVTVTGIGNYSDTGTIALLIRQRDLNDSNVIATFSPTVLTYSGNKQEPTVALTYNHNSVGTISTQYLNNVNAGKAQAVSSATADNNNFTGTRVDDFTILPREIHLNHFTVAAKPDSYHYTGKVITPTVDVKDMDTNAELQYATDYTVNSQGIQPGPHKATVTGIGNYTGTVEVSFTITSDPGQSVNGLELTLTPDEWTYGDTVMPSISVTFNGTEMDEKDYTLIVERDGTDLGTFNNKAGAIATLVEPGSYTITAKGIGSYANSIDTATVTIRKIQPTVTITATPSSLSGSGIVTLKLNGTNLPSNTDLPKLLTVTAANGTALDLTKLAWTEDAGAMTASFRTDNVNETYTFKLIFAGNDHYAGTEDEAVVVTAKHTSGGGGGIVDVTTYTITADAGAGGSISPEGKIAVVRGQAASFVISADNGYRIADVLVDGESMGPLTSYTFQNVSANHTISVLFEEGSEVADPGVTGVSDWLMTENHIQYLHGYGSGKFGPTDDMTRAQAAQMFYNLLLDKDITTTVHFTDVTTDIWYAEAVNTLASLGIVNGVGNNQFEPERSITRAEFTVMAMRFAKMDTSGEDIFPDVSQDDWFYDQVVCAVKYGWINGYADGTFRPNNTITRAEVTAIVNRMLDRSADQAFIDSHRDQLIQFTDVSQYYWAYYDIMEATNTHDHIQTNGTENWTGLQ